MASVNKIFLLGNVGKDPDVRYFDNGRAVANLTLATSESYKNKMGEKIEKTEWHQVVFWSPLAEIVEKYVKKGTQIHVEGKATSRSYTDKEGNKRYVNEVEARELVLLRKDNAQQTTDTPSNSPPDSSDPHTPPKTQGEGAGSEEDLPF